ncbi:MAG: sigma-54-dependent Fis family transcriptional regulator [Proteobacteria bacterium]|nr:MAG: sigma-54-dependent Fis family transcriptional regulator [Pseudomonadota bacterium]
MSPQFAKLAATDGTILITGRTGAGKTHLARELHNLSRRRSGKFMAINLATLSENLIESELFGHERGAFSGADSKRVGKLEIAQGGTVFLDEIGELPLRIQTKLLEALNSRTISPVGSNRELQLDVRIIAATNKDLFQEVEAGRFREDLFFRLNTFEIRMPELASQPDRIATLSESFARDAARQQGRAYLGMEPSFLLALRAYGWPGNVRELKNAMEYAVALNAEGPLDPEALPAYVKGGRENAAGSGPAGASPKTFPRDYREAKQQFERAYLREMLLRYHGRVNQTAKETGISKVTLIDKIRRYDIDMPSIKYEAHMTAKSLQTA